MLLKGLRVSEKSEIKRLKTAKAHKNSGRNTKKGDATWESFVVDIKEAKKSFTINEKVWAKITTDAIKAGINKSPALILVLGDGPKKTRLVVTELEVIKDMMSEV
jgi:outer membrane phospholipase A